jgi:hypothetical protein
LQPLCQAPMNHSAEGAILHFAFCILHSLCGRS